MIVLLISYGEEEMRTNLWIVFGIAVALVFIIYGCNSGGSSAITVEEADCDGDGVADDADNCPCDPNADQADGDGDTVGDVCDNCPDTSNPPPQGAARIPCDDYPDVTYPAQDDLDGDGLGDTCDCDADGDGYDAEGEMCEGDDCDDADAAVNPGAAEICNNEKDDDCDGFTDGLDPDCIEDTDGDTIPNGEDNCIDVYNPGQEDADSDGLGDVCDDCTDTDGDGFGNPGFALNTCPPDNCPAVANPGQEDANCNGIGDACDCPDRDADGVCDAVDNCPDHGNARQDDSDEDGIGDYCDNCPCHPNPEQTDDDHNGVGDVCADGYPHLGDDRDQDGITDRRDNCPWYANTGQENTDDDGQTSRDWKEGKGGDACDEPVNDPPCPRTTNPYVNLYC